MALLAPIVGGGVFGNLALLGLGLGIQLAAAYFFPQKVKGPRQDNLKAQTARYGDHLARVHGTGRTAGAVIWLKNDQVDEHKKKEQAGKGLGPETTTFSYTADFAVAFAWNGPFQSITRMWADDKEFYNNGAVDFSEIMSGGKKKKKKAIKNATVRVYLGTQDQLPDPSIEADRGPVPAWPGICYVVITGFPLDEFGIRIPNIEAEIVQTGTATSFGAALESPTINYPFAIDTMGNFVAVVDEGLLHINELPTGNLLHSKVVPDGVDNSNLHITEQFELIIPADPPFLFYVYNLETGALTGTFAWPTASGLASLVHAADDIVIGGVDYYFVHHMSTVGMFANEGSGYNLVSELASGAGALAPPLCLSAGGEYLYLYAAGTLNAFILIEWSPSGGLIVKTNPVPPGLTGTGPQFIHYHEASDSVIIGMTTGIFQYTPDLGTLLQSRTGDFTSGANTDPLASKRLDATATTIAVMDMAGGGLHDVWIYNVSDFSLVDHIVAASQPDWDESNNGQFQYYAYNQDWTVIVTTAWAATAGPQLWFLPMIQPDRIPLADVIEAECGYVLLPNDVSEITGDVRGYVVRDGSSPRGVIEDLQRVKFFDFAHVDGLTKFFMRGSIPSRTIALEHMGMSSGEPSPIFVQEEYADSRELPERVVIDYQSFEGDYRKGSQSIAAPLDLDETKATMQFQTSLIMEDDEAAQSADILFNETREAANIYRSTIAPRFIELHPGDIVALDLDEQRAVVAVLTKMEGEIAIDCEFRKRSSDFHSDAVGVATPPNDDSLLDIARAGVILIDGHLMRAADDSDSFYVGVYLAESGRFNSATVFRSTDDGSTYSPWLGFSTATLRGFADVALPSVPHPDAWDRSSTLTFAVIEEDGVPVIPSSVSDEALLSDDELNGFAVASGDEWEYIRAATVVDNGDGTFTLSNLLRGRKGTEFAIAGHSISDEVVYLDTSALDRSPNPDRTLERVYVPVSTSTVFDSTFAVRFTNAGRGLRPWSPVDIRGERDGSDNLTISWNRRDRLGQEWPEEGPEDPPLSESSESYIVTIVGSGSPPRTIAASSESAAYSAADQTTDFGSPQASVDVIVQQVSSVYGVGVKGEATI